MDNIIQINSEQTFINLKEGVEINYSDKIDEKDFFKIVKEFGINLPSFFKKRTNISEENVRKFNELLYICKTKYGLNIHTTLMFVEKNFVDFKKLLELLSQQNREILVREMAIKYKIKLRKNSLKKYLVF